jgi:hypothetical protein
MFLNPNLNNSIQACPQRHTASTISIVFPVITMVDKSASAWFLGLLIGRLVNPYPTLNRSRVAKGNTVVVMFCRLKLSLLNTDPMNHFHSLKTCQIH